MIDRVSVILETASEAQMAFPGGSADKVGNEFETWWTLRRMAELLDGKATAMAVEPLDANGAELWIEVDGTRSWDQVKYRSSGTWTVGRLCNDGLLAKLRPHYESGDSVTIVLSTPSHDFDRLIDTANSVESSELLWEVGDEEDLAALMDTWGATPDDTMSYLRQTRTVHHSPESLRDYVGLLLRQLIRGDVAVAVGAMRDFLAQRLNQPFTAQQLWQALDKIGIQPHPVTDPAPLLLRVRNVAKRYVKAARRNAPLLTIPRNEVGELVALIESTSSPIVIVEGRAGAGKSLVVAEAAERLAKAGRSVGAMRLDRVDANASSADDLGPFVGTDGSPVLALSSASRVGPNAVLVVDQLDAISTYSGRMPNVFEAVDELIDEARLVGNVKVVLAVRSIDLREDPRLRQLAANGAVSMVIDEFEAEDVRTYLTSMGANPSGLSAATLSLLRLPIHLYVFTQLDRALWNSTFASLPDLYEAYTDGFRTKLELDGFGDEWLAISRVMVDRMNSDEMLSVPRSALDGASVHYVKALISANVLISDRRRLSFFHETYFDYLFARLFGARGDDLVRWFEDSGQGLFRRSQLRQLLAYIASQERADFIPEVLTIINSSLRPHLVSIAYSVLPSIDPTVDEWIALKQLLTAKNPFANKILSLAGGPKWFTAIDRAADMDSLLDEPTTGEITAGLIARLSPHHPERVFELLQPRMGRGDAWLAAMRTATELAEGEPWVAYARRAIGTGELSTADQHFDVLGTSFFHRLVQASPTAAIDILSASLVQTIEVARTSGRRMEDGLRKRGRHALDADELSLLAASSPDYFVEQMRPLVIDIATHTSPDGHQTWAYRTPDRHPDLDGQLFFAFDGALRELADTDPPKARVHLTHLSAARVDSLDFLVCRSIGLVDSDEAVEWLLAEPSRMTLGWLSDIRWESRRLVSSVSPACSDVSYQKLEAAILYSTSEYERRATNLQWRGISELEMLSALPASRLGRDATKRLQELRRKFPNWEPIEPRGVSGGSVHSPIPSTALPRMSDAQWLRAIAKHSDDARVTFRDGKAFGGADELASQLGGVAKTDPDRFLKLALSLPPTTPAAFTEHLVRSLAGEVPQNDLAPLLDKFDAEQGDGAGRAVSAALAAYETELEEPFLHRLLALALHPDPTTELAKTKSGRGEYFGGDFVTAGLNSVRGFVASTIGSALFAKPGLAQELTPVIGRLARDPFIAVRSLAAEAVLALASADREEGLALGLELLGRDEVVGTAPGTRLLRWAMLWKPAEFSATLSAALSLDDAQSAGSVWANCWVNGTLGTVTSDLNALSDDARLGAAQAVSGRPDLDPALVVRLFDDRHTPVRKEAARALNRLNECDETVIDQLVTGFHRSRSFPELKEDLLDALADLPGKLPLATMEICVQTIDDLVDGSQGRSILVVRDLVTVLIKLYRAASATERDLVLDLIDRTAILQLWGADEELDNVR